jgi:hypothetical protein
MNEEWVNIAKFNNKQTANIALALLHDNDIAAVELDTIDSSLLMFGSYNIKVAKADEEKAKQLLENLIIE